MPGGEGLAAWARFRLGGLLLGQGRVDEAAVVLEAALTGLGTESHGDGAVVQARWWLGDCHRGLGEPREAAEAYLLAAELARHWPEQRDPAVLANLAADALGDAGLRESAERAYARAGELWLTVGNPLARIRTLRARAWLHTDGAAPGATARALGFMSEAASSGEAADGTAFRRRSRGTCARLFRAGPYVPPARRNPRRQPGGGGRGRRGRSACRRRRSASYGRRRSASRTARPTPSARRAPSTPPSTAGPGSPRPGSAPPSGSRGEARALSRDGA
ncbi:tetratricopeptide repeat domain-containing protein [Streptomyces sp. SPB074]|nr:tetratricopeptide repeat domain-containing protein [Streptomyces sp. SPB074]